MFCVYPRVFICKSVVGDPPERVYVGIVVRLRSDVHGNVVMTPSPTLDPIMVLETLAFLPCSVIAGGKEEACVNHHSNVDTRLNHYGNVKHLPVVTASGACVSCSPTHFLLYFPPFLSSHLLP